MTSIDGDITELLSGALTGSADFWPSGPSSSAPRPLMPRSPWISSAEPQAQRSGRKHRYAGSVALSVVAVCADVSRSVMIDVTELVGTVFSGLSALVLEDVVDAGDAIVVRARTREGAVACPGCGTETFRVHGYHERTAADVPGDGRRVVV